MRIKRFVAPNMRLAMNLVREELGEEAVIMSTRQTDDSVEVTAAVDPDRASSAMPSPINDSMQTPVTPQSTWQQPMNSAQSHALSSSAGADVGTLFHELKSMRAMLEQQLSGFAFQGMQVQSPIKVELLKRLAGLGMGWDLAQALVALVDDQAQDVESEWRLLQAELLSKIPVMHDRLLEEGGVVALVGPTGVGKTTTIAKLAARFVLRYGVADCAMVTLDTYKIGAQEQLKIFADLIGVPLYTARTPGEFFRLLEQLSTRKLVLVDTAGLSQRDARLQEYLADSLEDDSGQIQTLLVVSAATQLSVLREIISAFGRMHPKACILTKLDEATSLGPALTLLAENRLALAYSTNGQRVPEDLMPITTRDLLDQALVMGRARGQNVMDGAQYGFGREMTDV